MVTEYDGDTNSGTCKRKKTKSIYQFQFMGGDSSGFSQMIYVFLK